MLVIDASHEPLHGLHGRALPQHYDKYCYLPLYVSCGQDILSCVLRPSWRDPASVLSAPVRLIAERLRRA